eukprot:scaffold77336_cov59-Attheya_sp.AAC.2
MNDLTVDNTNHTNNNNMPYPPAASNVPYPTSSEHSMPEPTNSHHNPYPGLQQNGSGGIPTTNGFIPSNNAMAPYPPNGTPATTTPEPTNSHHPYGMPEPTSHHPYGGVQNGNAGIPTTNGFIPSSTFSTSSGHSTSDHSNNAMPPYPQNGAPAMTMPEPTSHHPYGGVQNGSAGVTTAMPTGPNGFIPSQQTFSGQMSANYSSGVGGGFNMAPSPFLAIMPNTVSSTSLEQQQQHQQQQHGPSSSTNPAAETLDPNDPYAGLVEGGGSIWAAPLPPPAPSPKNPNDLFSGIDNGGTSGPPLPSMLPPPPPTDSPIPVAPPPMPPAPPPAPAPPPPMPNNMAPPPAPVEAVLSSDEFGDFQGAESEEEEDMMMPMGGVGQSSAPNVGIVGSLAPPEPPKPEPPAAAPQWPGGMMVGPNGMMFMPVMGPNGTMVMMPMMPAGSHHSLSASHSGHGNGESKHEVHDEFAPMGGAVQSSAPNASVWDDPSSGMVMMYPNAGTTSATPSMPTMMPPVVPATQPNASGCEAQQMRSAWS